MSRIGAVRLYANGKYRRRGRFLEFSVAMIAVSLVSAAGVLLAESQTSPQTSWQNLRKLAITFYDESTPPASRTKTAQEILDVSAQLLDGPMAPSAARSIVEVRKPFDQLTNRQKRYVLFWVLRARAAVEADNESAGLETAIVLKQLGANLDHAVKSAMAWLDTMGWLDAPEPAEWQKFLDAEAGPL